MTGSVGRGRCRTRRGPSSTSLSCSVSYRTDPHAFCTDVTCLTNTSAHNRSKIRRRTRPHLQGCGNMKLAAHRTNISLVCCWLGFPWSPQRSLLKPLGQLQRRQCEQNNKLLRCTAWHTGDLHDVGPRWSITSRRSGWRLHITPAKRFQGICSSEVRIPTLCNIRFWPQLDCMYFCERKNEATVCNPRGQRSHLRRHRCHR
mmetsp:Transcript_123259/g.224102  ORF Transcript_123259/g.224102 Transcript_123259/m.224102 type:complete len:201 (-) Transcript_123259:1037-1639(-)